MLTDRPVMISSMIWWREWWHTYGDGDDDKDKDEDDDDDKDKDDDDDNDKDKDDERDVYSNVTQR